MEKCNYAKINIMPRYKRNHIYPIISTTNDTNTSLLSVNCRPRLVIMPAVTTPITPPRPRHVLPADVLPGSCPQTLRGSSFPASCSPRYRWGTWGTTPSPKPSPSATHSTSPPTMVNSTLLRPASSSSTESDRAPAVLQRPDLRLDPAACRCIRPRGGVGEFLMGDLEGEEVAHGVESRLLLRCIICFYCKR